MGEEGLAPPDSVRSSFVSKGIGRDGAQSEAGNLDLRAVSGS